MVLIISTISLIVTMASIEQKANTATSTTTDINTNTINCQGGTNTAVFGTLKYAGGKCTGQNGGTVAAGGIKSDSGAVGTHRTQGPNGNSHFGGFIRR